MSRRLLVIGAGPIGIAAALSGLRHGMDVTVLERDRIGASLLRWGPTRFFSPLRMNLPRDAAELLEGRLPDGELCLTGPEFVDQVLVPLTELPALAGRVRVGNQVVALGRAGMTRGDYPGHPVRASRPFRALVETPEGELCVEADAVLDASGTHGSPVSIGSGGLPALGERAVGPRVIQHLGDLHTRLPALAGTRVLLVGHGHSAATALGLLARTGDTRVTWAVRTPNLLPCTSVASDPLPERDVIVSGANELARRPPPWLRVERRATVVSIVSSGGGVRVTLSGDRVIDVDSIVGMTGYRPDLSFLSELAVEIAPETEGAARLGRALAGVTDCLSVPAVSPADLASGEPGFHLAGAKSYGRGRTFLLATGYDQLETMIRGLATDIAW